MSRRMNAVGPEAGSESDLELAALRRQNHALLVERDRLQDALGRSQSNLTRQLEDWQELHAMSTELLRAPTLNEQFDVVLRAVTRFHATARGLISLFDPASGALLSQSGLGLSRHTLDTFAAIPVGS